MQKSIKECQIAFYNFFFQFTLPPAWDKGAFLTTLSLALLSIIFSNFVGDKSYLTVLNCISLIASKVEKIFYIFIAYK